MNAKELIEAAERLHILVRYGGTEYATELNALALHILATVKPDDDEPIDWQWIALALNSRGQFRALCRGLGIALKEGGNE